MADMPIRVAMIGQKGYPPIHGGIEKHVAELAERMVDDGCQVDIYSRPHYSDAVGQTQSPGITVRKLPSIPTKHLDAISHTMLCSAHSLSQKYDIVHYHAMGPGLLSWLPRWFGGARTIVTIHGLDWQRDKWGGFARNILRMGESASIVMPNRTIVVSRALREYFLQKYKRTTDYIPNGIVPPVYRERDLLLQRGIAGKFVLFVGRLVPEKGCHFLLEAWSRLPQALRQAYRLVIAGDAGFTSSYVDGLKRAAPTGVDFLGYIHGALLEELYTNAEMLVMPSTLEGLSITLLEGMSYARCCLVSDIPPNLEAGAEYAEYFPSGDVGALADKLAKLLPQVDKRRQIGEKASLHAIENYSWERVTALTTELYREIL